MTEEFGPGIPEAQAALSDDDIELWHEAAETGDRLQNRGDMQRLDAEMLRQARARLREAEGR